jgi:hypothetical protein
MLFNSTLAAQCIKESEYSKRTQAGIDLSVMKIEFINPKKGSVCILKNKTEISPKIYEELNITHSIDDRGRRRMVLI